MRIISGAVCLATIAGTVWAALDPTPYADALWVVLFLAHVVSVMLLRKIRHEIVTSLSQAQHAPIHPMYMPAVPGALAPHNSALTPPGIVAVTFPVGSLS